MILLYGYAYKLGSIRTPVDTGYLSAAFFYCLSAITVRKEGIMEGFS
ncbi:hypothetical protein EMIT074MI3_12559 [Bacillus licheniformis]